MRTLSVKAAALAVLVGSAALAAQPPDGKDVDQAIRSSAEFLAQQLKPKSKLELALEAALKNNPDLRVAVARAAVAEAELARTRLQVTRKVVTTHAALESARSELALANAALAKTKAWADERPGHRDAELRAAQNTAVQASTKAAAAQAELDYLLGKSPASASAPRALVQQLTLSEDEMRAMRLEYARRLTVKEDTAAKLRKAAERAVTVKLANKSNSDLLDVVRELAPGLHIQAPSLRTDAAWKEPVTVNLSNVALSTVIQLLEDNTDHRFVVRDYGLLVVPRDKVPPGATLLGDILKKPAEKTKPAAKP